MHTYATEQADLGLGTSLGKTSKDIEYTPEQAAILFFIQNNPEHHVIVNSTAGSGKSFIANEVAKLLGEEFYTMGLSFSNIGVRQLKGFDHATTTTSLGNAICTNHFWSSANRPYKQRRYKRNPKFDKFNFLTNKAIKEYNEDMDRKDKVTIRKLVDMLRSTAAETQEDAEYAWQLVSDEEFNKDLYNLAEDILQQGLYKFRANCTTDYTDCIYLPAKLDMAIDGRLYTGNGQEYMQISKYEWVLVVDEYQDLSKSEILLVTEFAQQNGARLIFVGDDAQAIYGWRGASGNATKEILSIFVDSEIMHLTKTFRCPTSHTGYVRETMDERFNIHSYHDKDGKLQHTNSVAEALEYVNQDEKILITARNFNGKKSKIIPAMHHIIANTDYTIRLEGFNLEFVTKRLLDELETSNLDVSQADQAIANIFEKEELKIDTDPNHFCNFTELREELDFAKLVINFCVDCTTVAEIRNFIKTQINDPNAQVVFSTVFRIKGETFYQTILLDPVARHNIKNHPDINAQEENILFVGLTRATDNLILVWYPEE